MALDNLSNDSHSEIVEEKLYNTDIVEEQQNETSTMIDSMFNLPGYYYNKGKEMQEKPDVVHDNHIV